MTFPTSGQCEEERVPKYCYEMCVDQGTVPKEPLLTATGKELNEVVRLVRESRPWWYYWNDKSGEYEDSELADLHFEEEREYALRELGWFEWEGCVWNEPLMFSYNKWKHTGDPTPMVLYTFEEKK